MWICDAWVVKDRSVIVVTPRRLTLFNIALICCCSVCLTNSKQVIKKFLPLYTNSCEATVYISDPNGVNSLIFFVQSSNIKKGNASSNHSHSQLLSRNVRERERVVCMLLLVFKPIQSTWVIRPTDTSLEHGSVNAENGNVTKVMANVYHFFSSMLITKNQTSFSSDDSAFFLGSFINSKPETWWTKTEKLMLVRVVHLGRIRYYLSNVENRFIVRFWDNNEVRTAMGLCWFASDMSLIFRSMFL